MNRLIPAILLSLPLLAAGQTDNSAQADLILAHGQILTVDVKDNVAQAIAIRGNLILKTGTDAEIFALAAPGAKIIDLHGMTVTPGLIDTHAHIAGGGVDELFGVKLSDTTSIPEILARVQAKVSTKKPGEWIVGAGWDEGKLSERRYPTAQGTRPCCSQQPRLAHAHHWPLRSSQLRRSQTRRNHRQHPRPQSRHHRPRSPATHQPTGVLKEDSAMEPIVRLLPAVTPEQERQGILYIQNILHSEGMTAVKDPDITQFTWDAYKAVLDSGLLKERVCVLWHAGSTVESAQKALAQINKVPRLPKSLGDSRLLSCGAKIYMDGSGGARTGWVYDDWFRNATEAETGNHGYPQTDPATYQKMVRLFHNAGVPVGTHAVGDRAMDWVVDTYNQVERDNPRLGLRHSIIHANLPTPHAIEVMAAMQRNFDAGYPELQAEFLWWIGDIYAASYGKERGQQLVPLKTLKDKGIFWSSGSDYSVTPIAARYGLWASVARQTLKGTYGLQPFGTAEATDVHTALRSYTTWSARQMFLEDKIGSLEPGKRADLAIWDRNLYTIPTDQIKDMKCLMTLLDGEIVYTAPDSPITVTQQ